MDDVWELEVLILILIWNEKKIVRNILEGKSNEEEIVLLDIKKKKIQSTIILVQSKTD